MGYSIKCLMCPHKLTTASLALIAYNTDETGK